MIKISFDNKTGYWYYQDQEENSVVHLSAVYKKKKQGALLK
jgi:hypothetical protein